MTQTTPAATTTEAEFPCCGWGRMVQLPVTTGLVAESYRRECPTCGRRYIVWRRTLAEGPRGRVERFDWEVEHV